MQDNMSGASKFAADSVSSFCTILIAYLLILVLVDEDDPVGRLMQVYCWKRLHREGRMSAAAASSS